MRVRALQLLANSYLPEYARDYNMDFSDKGLNKTLFNIAQHEGGKAMDNAEKALSRVGLMASYLNGNTMTLDDLRPVIDRKPYYEAMDKELAALDKKDPEYKKKRDSIMQKYNVAIDKATSEAALKARNNIALSVLSGARGKKDQLKAMISTPGTYTDANGDPVPVFSRQSFAEGIRPVTYLAGAYGTRFSVATIKRGTAKGGDLAKQFAQSAADMVIRKDDCGTHNGIPLKVDDKSCKGRVLARDAGGYKEGTFITSQMLHDLEKKGITDIVARSPLTCSVENGLCAKCMGKYFDGGRYPHIGDHVGALSSSTSTEPVAQGALCLAEGTMVRMADGSEKAIQDIVPGDMVMGADKNADAFPVRVVRTYDQGEKDVRTYEFAKDGRTTVSVVATDDHKILVNHMSMSQWNKDKYGSIYGADPYALTIRPLGKANKGTYAVYPNKVSCFGTIHKEPIMAFLAGLFLGDGCRTYKWSVLRISCADPVLAAAISKDLEPFGMRFRKLQRGYDWGVVRNDTAGRNKAKLIIEEMGFDGKYCYEKVIPDTLFSWDEESLSNFIAGYFDSDGSIYRVKAGQYGISFGSTSRQLLETLKLLMETRYAIYSSVISWQDKNRRRPLYKLSIDRQDMVLRFKDAFLRYSKGVRQLRLAGVTLVGQDRNPSGLKRGKLKKKSDLFKAHCYDIEVDHPDHLFVLANGIITSNSTKHSGGMTEGKKEYSGLETLIQFTQSPEKFKDRAAVATVDGRVESITDAPQGGKYIKVAGQEHYVPAGHEPEVQVGQTVEAGDFLSEGLGDAEDVVKYKGLGAGRLYYANRFNKMLADSGSASDKRLTEVLARAALRHVRITSDDGYGNYLPDDVVDYSSLQSTYKMPETTQLLASGKAVGKYLQHPAMHYTIGTRITPSVAKDLEAHGYGSVYADETKPDFEPEMIRLRGASHTNPDWLASQGTSYLTKQLEEAVTKGDDTNVYSNPDWRPRLAFGKDFGKNLEETGEF